MLGPRSVVTFAVTLTLVTSLGFISAQDEQVEKEASLDSAFADPKSVPAWAQVVPYAPISQLYTSMSKLPGARVYHNVWWHNHRFFAVVHHDDVLNSQLFDDGLSVGQVLTRIPILDLPAHAAASRLAFLPGVSAMVDFPFQSMSDHLGHWAEIMVPLYSVLTEGSWRSHVRGAGSQQPVVDRLVMPNMNRDVSPWFRVIMQAACSPAVRKGSVLPTLVDYAELYTYDNLAWLVIENLLVADDRYTHPQAKRGFVSADHGDLWRHDNCQRYVSPTHVVQFAKPQYGRAFRDAIWQMAGLGSPPAWTQGTPAAGLPRVITLILTSGDKYPGITNHEELRQALEQVAAENGLQVLVVSLAPGSSFGSHLAAISGSGVLVGRHASIMASSMLLPPGAMVLELLPYKWEWAKLSMLYHNITRSIGDIHHFAWRPQHYRFAKFRNASDLRYHTWTPEECSAYECLNKLVKADIIADVPAVVDILRTKIPAVLRGESVDKLREPWPEAV